MMKLPRSRRAAMLQQLHLGRLSSRFGTTYAARTSFALAGWIAQVQISISPMLLKQTRISSLMLAKTSLRSSQKFGVSRHSSRSFMQLVPNQSRRGPTASHLARPTGETYHASGRAKRLAVGPASPPASGFTGIVRANGQGSSTWCSIFQACCSLYQAS